MQHLILNLEAPLMAFGGETIDNYGVIRPFPAASMFTGLLANALGWRRIERERHQRLQDRLVFAARIDRGPHGRLSMRDFQTAQLGKDDKGWTTRGTPESRTGGANTYDAPHLRYRDYYPDMRVTVALRLEPDADDPTLEALGGALQEPARPLFIGRKPCLPSAPLFREGDIIDAGSVLEALKKAPIKLEKDPEKTVRLMWPQGEGVDDPAVKLNEIKIITDERNWVSGLHGGGRAVCEGTVPREWFSDSYDSP